MKPTRRWVGLAALAALAAVTTGCGGPEVAYRKALRANTTAEYRAFIDRYGTTEFATEISARLEDRWFRDVKEARTAAGYAPAHVVRLANDFLSEYPAAKRTAVVQSIRDEVAFELRVIEVSPVPELDGFEGGSDRVGSASGKISFTPGDIRFVRLSPASVGTDDPIGSAEILIKTKPPLPPVELFVARVQDGAEVVLGMEVPRVAPSGEWGLTGAVVGKTLGGVEYEVPFDVNLKVGPAGSDMDARYAAALAGTYREYTRRASLRETERDKNGYCRSSRPDLKAKCFALTVEADLLRRLVLRAVKLLKEVSATGDEAARAVAADFFEKNPRAADEVGDAAKPAGEAP